jgi:hypothetical protein
VHISAALLSGLGLDWVSNSSRGLDLEAEATRKEALYWNGQVQSTLHPDFVTVLFMQELRTAMASWCCCSQYM